MYADLVQGKKNWLVANESWIDESGTGGKNEVNLPLAESGMLSNKTSPR